MSKEIKWIVKNDQGHIKGPYSTTQIVELISVGTLIGEESVAFYPGGDWIPIGQNPQFYDKLLVALEEGFSKEVPDEVPDEMLKKEVSQIIDPDESYPSESQSDESQSVESPDGEQETVIISTTELKKRYQASENRPEKNRPEQKANLSKPPPIIGESLDEKPLSESQDESQEKPSKQIGKAFLKGGLFLLAAGSLVLVVFFFLIVEESPEKKKYHFLRPQKEESKLEAKKINSIQNIGLEHFAKGDLKSLLRAQELFVEAYQGSFKQTFSATLLCLAYRELWDHAFQDSQDRGTVEQVSRKTSVMGPGTIDATQCSITNMIVLGRQLETKGVVNQSLELIDELFAKTKDKNKKRQLTFHGVFLYQLNGELLFSRKDYNLAIAYFEKARQLWPKWLKPYIMEARAKLRIQKYGESATLYQQALKMNKNHSEAKVRLGLLEYREFQNVQKGLKLIESGLKSKNELTGELESEAYLALAQFYSSQDKMDKALSYARECYKINRYKESCRKIVVDIGGVEGLKKTTQNNAQQVYLGDEFAKQGDCFTAQAEYKAAFEANPKNAMAAFKAAQCLWKLNQGTESILWLKKAIKSDRRLLRAYVLLSDYYSQRYNFSSAVRVLARAKKINPKNHEVYKGYAQLSIRKNDARSAKTYALKALKYYEGDAELYMILAKALLWLKDNKGAFRQAHRGVELDSTNPQAHIVYAEVLSETQGGESGIYYLQEMVNKYPYIPDYRLALGKTYKKDDRLEMAKKELEQALGLEPNNKKVLMELALTYQALGEFRKALTTFLEAATKDPSDPEALFYVGLLYLEINQPKKALRQFQRVLRVNPLYPRVHYFMGRAYLAGLNPDPQKAIEEAFKERKKNPVLADSYLLAAEAYSLSRQYAACAQEYQKAIKILPQGAIVYVKMARCYRKAGSVDIAKAMLGQAQKRESGLPEVYKELGAVLELMGNKQEAVVAYEKYLALSPNAKDREIILQKIKRL